MKKFQTLAVYASAALMAFSLAACGSDDEAPFNPVPSPTTPPSGPTEFVPEANAQQAAKYNISGGFQSDATNGKAGSAEISGW